MKISFNQSLILTAFICVLAGNGYGQTNPVTPPPTTPVTPPATTPVVSSTGQVVSPTGQVVSPAGQVVSTAAPVVAPAVQVLGPNGQVVTATTIPPNTPTAIAMRNSGVKRPTDSLGVADIDQYVTQCYNFYDQTNLLSYRLDVIEQETMVNKAADMDTKKIDQQLDDYKAQAINLHTVGANLLIAGSTMTDKATNDLKTRPLRIPGAIVRVHNSTKAVNISLQNIYNMTTVTMVNIRKRLGAAEATSTATAPVATSLPVTGKTVKTSVDITGISFSTFNALAAELTTMQGIKSVDKKFKASGTSVIELVHYGTTDGLLGAMLFNCKDIVSDKNVGGSEKGKISLTF